MDYTAINWIILEENGVYRIKIKDTLIRWRILEKMEYKGENRVYFSIF